MVFALLIVIVLAILFPRFMRAVLLLLPTLFFWNLAQSIASAQSSSQTDDDAGAAAKLGCWSIADTALRVECVKEADDIDAYSANALALSAMCHVPKVRNELIQYAHDRGESEYEFAARLKSDIYGIEKLACMAEAGGATATEAFQSLENSAAAIGDSSSPDTSAATSLPDDFPQHDVNADCKKMADSHFPASERNSAGVLAPSLQESWNMYFNRCIDDEQMGYDYLKSVWPNLSADVKHTCMSMRPPRAYIYHTLMPCISARYDYQRKAKSQHSFQK